MLLLNSGIILTSFLAGIVALLAPCCVSVMLPAYFASGLRRRRRILGMTFVFATGVATIILPIALGASVLSRVLNNHHTPVFATGGALMVLAGIAALAGHSVKLPMPVSAPMRREGVTSVWALGAFSGAASACCAPVLAGVAGLAGATASFPLALSIGAAYVFGMVAPLALLALVWDLKDWGAILAPDRRALRLRLGGRTLRIPLVNALTGTLLLAMGALTIRSAFIGPGMSNKGWQVHLTAQLNHLATSVQHDLAFLPGWAATGLVIVLAALLVLAARRLSLRGEDKPDPSDKNVPLPLELDLHHSDNDRNTALR